MAKQPIRVFYSPLSGRFFATRRWHETGPGEVKVTGEKFDVTNDIAHAVLRHELVFEQVVTPAAPSVPGRDAVTVSHRATPETPHDAA